MKLIGSDLSRSKIEQLLLEAKQLDRVAGAMHLERHLYNNIDWNWDCFDQILERFTLSPEDVDFELIRDQHVLSISIKPERVGDGVDGF